MIIPVVGDIWKYEQHGYRGIALIIRATKEWAECIWIDSSWNGKPTDFTHTIISNLSLNERSVWSKLS